MPLLDLQSAILFWIADDLDVGEHLPNSALVLRKGLSNGGAEAARVRSLKKVASLATRMKLIIGNDGYFRRVK